MPTVTLGNPLGLLESATRLWGNSGPFLFLSRPIPPAWRTLYELSSTKPPRNPCSARTAVPLEASIPWPADVGSADGGRRARVAAPRPVGTGYQWGRASNVDP
ncbi:MAG: hypothetical protein L7F78_14695, partial [Syntrophales bacterium LBB04]|nr:hypothetical protein [Syntrophales bacterium LBB04]